MEWLTIGLVVFAGVQVLVQHWSERRRVKERREDVKLRDEAAVKARDRIYQDLWAEHFRLDSLAAQWKEADLLELAVLGVLNVEEVLPVDRTSAAAKFAGLGLEAGYLGGVGLTFASDLARHIALLNGLVRSFRSMQPGLTDADLLQVIGTTQTEYVTKLEDSLRRGVRELSILYWDAISHSEAGSVQRTLNFKDDMQSEFARTAVNSLKGREVTEQRSNRVQGLDDDGPA